MHNNSPSPQGLRSWLILVVLCMAGGSIYLLPFLREVYYLPMQEALGFSHGQLGTIQSVFGAVALLSYFPGGWLADRLSARGLISAGLIGTAGLGFYFATFPGYQAALIIHAGWGLTTSLLFWSALVSATRAWGGNSDQGKAFGFLESGRGVTEALASTLLLSLFAWWGSHSAAFADVVRALSTFCLSLGVLAWWVLPTGVDPQLAGSPKQIKSTEVLNVLRMPAVWSLSLVVLAAYSAYWGTFYFAAYSSEVFLLSTTLGATLAVARMWFKPFVAIGAGVAADRFGAARCIVALFLALVLSFLFFAGLPGAASLVPVMIANALLASLCVFALRAIYFALLEEVGIARSATGIVTGLVSAIGFSPDVFMPLLGGYLLDNYAAELAYRILFAALALLSAAGAAAAFSLQLKARQ